MDAHAHVHNALKRKAGPEAASGPAKKKAAVLVPPRFSLAEPDELELLRQVVDVLIADRQLHDDRSAKVVEYQTPQDLSKIVDVSLPDEGAGLEEGMRSIKDLLRFSTRSHHPRFLNQLFAAADTVSVIGEVVSTFMNSSMYTYETAPVLSLMENEVVRNMCKLIGPAYKNAEGIFTPGGSLANIMAMAVARNHAVDRCQDAGIGGTKLVAFTSALSHYSMAKGANLIGVGREAGLVRVPCDQRGRMVVAELEKAVAAAKREGCVPFMVIGTSGSTVQGAFDDLKGINRVARANGMWFHVDGALGGSLLFSERHRHLLDGVELSDSMTWNAHKLMGMTQQCAMLITKQPGKMMRSFSESAGYLFKTRDLQDMLQAGGDEVAAELDEKKFDSGDKTIQCGRRNDVFKLWLTWKVRGAQYFGQRIDHAFDLRDGLLAELSARQDRFRLVAQPDAFNVCFWFMPPSSRPSPSNEQLGRATQCIRRRMHADGTALIAYMRQQELPQFFRFAFNSPHVDHADVADILDAIEAAGADL